MITSKFLRPLARSLPQKKHPDFSVTRVKTFFSTETTTKILSNTLLNSSKFSEYEDVAKNPHDYLTPQSQDIHNVFQNFQKKILIPHIKEKCDFYTYHERGKDTVETDLKVLKECEQFLQTAKLPADWKNLLQFARRTSEHSANHRTEILSMNRRIPVPEDHIISKSLFEIALETLNKLVAFDRKSCENETNKNAQFSYYFIRREGVQLLRNLFRLGASQHLTRSSVRGSMLLCLKHYPHLYPTIFKKYNINWHSPHLLSHTFIFPLHVKDQEVSTWQTDAIQGNTLFDYLSECASIPLPLHKKLYYGALAPIETKIPPTEDEQKMLDYFNEDRESLNSVPLNFIERYPGFYEANLPSGTNALIFCLGFEEEFKIILSQGSQMVMTDLKQTNWNKNWFLIHNSEIDDLFF